MPRHATDHPGGPGNSRGGSVGGTSTVMPALGASYRLVTLATAASLIYEAAGRGRVVAVDQQAAQRETDSARLLELPPPPKSGVGLSTYAFAIRLADIV